MLRPAHGARRWARVLVWSTWLAGWALVASPQGCSGDDASPSGLGGGGAGGNAAACVGVTPPASAWGAEPGPINHPGGDGGAGQGGAGQGGAAQGGAAQGGAAQGGDGSGGMAMGGAGGAGGGPDLPVPPGAMAPSWSLLDRQPDSCGYDATYGLDLFRGQVTVVAMWAGW